MQTNYHEIISNAGIRPSVQRVAVYEYLDYNKNHPSVDTIFESLSPKYPTLSRTTIYNTLKLFEEKKLVQSIQIEDDKLIYDCDTSDHIHFKCSKCGKVFDVFEGKKIPVQNMALNSFLPQGFKSEKVQTNIWGLCSDCSSKA